MLDRYRTGSAATVATEGNRATVATKPALLLAATVATVATEENSKGTPQPKPKQQDKTPDPETLARVYIFDCDNRGNRGTSNDAGYPATVEDSSTVATVAEHGIDWGTGRDTFGKPLPPPRPLVTCGACQHFDPDPINPPAGAGICRADVGLLSIGPCLHPMAPRHCDHHLAVAQRREDRT